MFCNALDTSGYSLYEYCRGSRLAAIRGNITGRTMVALSVFMVVDICEGSQRSQTSRLCLDNISSWKSVVRFRDITHVINVARLQEIHSDFRIAADYPARIDDDDIAESLAGGSSAELQKKLWYLPSL